MDSESTFSRREFLRTLAVAGAGLYLVRLPLTAAVPYQKKESKAYQMKYRLLGRTGLNVSVIGLGCEGFSGKSAQELGHELDFAQEHGINFIDLYASDPQLRSNLGKALKGRRKKFLIQGHICSTWENGQYLRTRDVNKTKAAFRDLLQRLSTDYVDIGMIHYVDDVDDFHTVFDGEIIRLVNQYKREGQIRYIGISSHNTQVARMAVETGLVDVLMFSLNPAYDMMPDPQHKERQLLDPQRKALYELCARTNVGIDVMKAFGGGNLLSDKNSPFGKALTPAQCIEYALSRPGVASVMCGCNGLEQMQQSLDWCTATAAQKDYAATLATAAGYSWKGQCMYCGHCAPCVKNIDIASVNKYLNLALAGEQIPETVRDHYKLLAHHAGECVECGACMKRCPFEVNIIAQMRKAKKVFGY